jgi:hypothetical protein
MEKGSDDRRAILSGLRHGASKSKTEEGAKKLFEVYLDGLTPEGRKKTKKTPQDFFEKPEKPEKGEKEKAPKEKGDSDPKPSGPSGYGRC